MKLKTATFFMDGEGGGEGGGGGSGGGSLLATPPGGGGSGAVDWRATLPEDIRADPSLASFKAKDGNEALGLIAKSFVHAQKLIGVDKILKPSDKWTPEQWREWGKSLGVPETHDKYAMPDVKLVDGLTLDDKKMDAFKKVFHDANMTPRQVNMVLKAYLDDVNGDFTGRQEQTATQMKASENELKQEFGDKYEAKLDIARAVLKKYGSDTLLDKLEKSGLANDPEVVKMFATLGEGMMEDTANGGGNGLIVREATQALQEINKLKSDTEFQAALNNRTNAGHKAAVDKWYQLHQAAAATRE